VGAWVAFYIYFVGLSAGAFLVSTANVFEIEGMHRIDRDALFAAIISMVVALLFVWIDLGRMDRMYFPFIWRQLTSALFGKSTPTWPTSAFWSRSYTSRCGSTSRGSPTAPRGFESGSTRH